MSSPMLQRRAASRNSASPDDVDGKKVAVTRRSCSQAVRPAEATSAATALPKTGRKLLIVAPMSGHYATLLRGTVERMLPKP